MRRWTIALALGLTACSERPDSQARATLHAAGYHFEAADYCRAAREGKSDLVDCFIAAGMNPSLQTSDGKSALAEAAQAGQGQVVRLLLHRGTKPEPSYLPMAINGGDLDAVKALLAAMPQDTPLRARTLIDASRHGRTNVLPLLLPAETHTLDEALSVAATAGHTGCVALLLDAGASPYDLRADGKTPLMRAAAAGHTEAALWLRDHGSAVTMLDPEGRCAADLAPTLALRTLLLQTPRDSESTNYPPLRELTDIPATNAASIAAEMDYIEHRAASLPFQVEYIRTASLTLLGHSQDDPVDLKVDDPVPGTDFLVKEISTGQPPATPGRAILMNPAGTKILLVQGIRAQRPEPAAIVRLLTTGERYEITTGATVLIGDQTLTITAVRAGSVDLQLGTSRARLLRKQPR